MFRIGIDLRDKSTGFYVAVFASFLCFTTAVIYYSSYKGDQYYAANVFYTLLCALPIAVIMMLTKTEAFVPTVLTALSGLAVLEFIYAMYWDVSVVLVGIDKTSFDTRFITCCVLLIISFIVSEISLYTNMKKRRKS